MNTKSIYIMHRDYFKITVIRAKQRQSWDTPLKTHALSCCRKSTHTQHTMTMCHMWNAWVKTEGSTVRMCCHLPPHFHTAILNCLSIPLLCWGNDSGDYSSHTENVTLLLNVGKKFNETKLSKIWVWKHINWVKIQCAMKFSYCSSGKILLCGKCIKRAKNMLIVWESSGTKLFWHLQHNNFLCGCILCGFTILCNQKSFEILHVNALAVGLSLHYNTCTTILTLPREAGTLAFCRSLSWTLAICIIWLLTRGTRAPVHLTSASSEQRWAITNQLLGSRYACSCSDNSMQTRCQKCGSSTVAAKNITHLLPLTILNFQENTYT